MKNSFKIALSAGEVSGDYHLSEVVKEVRLLLPQASFFGVGGDSLQAQNVSLLSHIKEFGGVMGFGAVLQKIGKIFSVFSTFKKELLLQKPDLLIVCDFPDFNLRLAKFAKKQGIPVLYYIPPKVWAWRKSRIKVIEKYCDRVALIFPFEEKFYRDNQLKNAVYVGHPYLTDSRFASERESILHSAKSGNGADHFSKEPPQFDKNYPYQILFFPGSRRSEIERHMPQLIASAKNLKADLPNLQVVIGKAQNTEAALLTQYFTEEEQNWISIKNGSTELMRSADAGVIKSGTGTLEAACIGIPFVCVYNASLISAFIVRQLLKISAISLVNLIKPHSVVELLQENFNAEQVTFEVLNLLKDSASQRASFVSVWRSLYAGFEKGDTAPPKRVAAVAQELIT